MDKSYGDRLSYLVASAGKGLNFNCASSIFVSVSAVFLSVSYLKAVAFGTASNSHFGTSLDSQSGVLPKAYL